MSAKFNLVLEPKSKLEVSQNTKYTGYINQNSHSSSSEYLDLIYELKADFIFKTDTVLDFGFEAKYKHLPLKYNLELSDGSKEHYDVVEHISYFAVKAYLNVEVWGFKPMAGFSREYTYGTDQIKDDDYSKKENKLILGIAKQF